MIFQFVSRSLKYTVNFSYCLLQRHMLRSLLSTLSGRASFVILEGTPQVPFEDAEDSE